MPRRAHTCRCVCAYGGVFACLRVADGAGGRKEGWSMKYVLTGTRTCACVVAFFSPVLLLTVTA